MKKFLGLLILMGQTKKTHWRDYWSMDPLGLIDAAQNIFSGDSLCQIRHLLNFLIPKFQSLYVPKQQLSLGETMIPWRGLLASEHIIRQI